MGPRVSLAGTTTSLPLAHRDCAAAAGGPGDGPP
jgi:hypothetical protein